MIIPFDVTQPPPRPQTLEQAQALIDVLWDTLGQMQARILELEERLRLTSRNSSKPPSSDGLATERRGPGRRGRGRRCGGQPGHPGVKRALVPLEEVDQVYPCWPAERCACGGEIRPAVTSTPSMFSVLKPGSEKLTRYVPATNSVKR